MPNKFYEACNNYIKDREGLLEKIEYRKNGDVVFSSTLCEDVDFCAGKLSDDRYALYGIRCTSHLNNSESLCIKLITHSKIIGKYAPWSSVMIDSDDHTIEIVVPLIIVTNEAFREIVDDITTTMFIVGSMDNMIED